MSGLEIASLIGAIIEGAAPLLSRALELGEGYDPVLERQLHALMALTAQRYSDIDAALAAEDAVTDKRLPPKGTP